MARTRAMENGSAIVDPPGGCEHLARRTNVDIALPVEGEVSAGEGAILAPLSDTECT